MRLLELSMLQYYLLCRVMCYVVIHLVLIGHDSFLFIYSPVQHQLSTYDVDDFQLRKT